MVLKQQHKNNTTTEFPLLSVDSRVGISRSTSKTDDRFYVALVRTGNSLADSVPTIDLDEIYIYESLIFGSQYINIF